MIEQLNNVAANRMDALWDASVQGGAALLIVWGLCRFVPRLSPGFKVWLWRIAWFKFLLAFFWNGSIDLPVLSTSAEAPAPMQVTPSLEATPELSIAPSAAIQPSVNSVTVLLIVWLLGVFVCIVHLMVQWTRVTRLKAAAIPSQLGSKIPVLQSNDLTAPVLVGILRPAIILPSSLVASASPDRLRMMLAHELAHLQRRDLLWGWLPAICQALFFFHPLLWLTRREWLLAQEMACDELALRQCNGSAGTYGNMLVDLLASDAPRPLFGAASIFENTRNLKRRIQAMKTIGTRRSRWLMVALLLVSVTGILPWRIVAQDRPEDTSKRIQQLEGQNARLRQELEKLKQGSNGDQLAAAISAAKAEIEVLRGKFTDEHPTVIRAQERLQKLREADLGRRLTNAVRAANVKLEEKVARRDAEALAAQQRELYLAEADLAQKYADFMRRQVDNGRATHEDLLRAQRQLFGIKREMANLDQNRAKLKELVQQEMEIVQRLLKEAKKLIDVGLAPAGHDLDLQREMLKLKRELLLLE